MDEPEGARAAGFPTGAGDADVLVTVLRRVGRCSVRELLMQPELTGWTSDRLQEAVVSAWSGGSVFIDRNDDLVAL